MSHLYSQLVYNSYFLFHLIQYIIYFVQHSFSSAAWSARRMEDVVGGILAADSSSPAESQATGPVLPEGWQMKAVRLNIEHTLFYFIYYCILLYFCTYCVN